MPGRSRNLAALHVALEELTSLPSDCVVWTGTIDRYGYGRFGDRNAHRVVFQTLVGPVPPGLQLDHLCHDPAACPGGPSCPHRRCVNPDHLQVTTHRENSLRGNSPAAQNARQTSCLSGHDFTPENTRFAQGRRFCRACDRRRQAEHKARRLARAMGGAA